MCMHTRYVTGLSYNIGAGSPVFGALKSFEVFPCCICAVPGVQLTIV